MAEMELKIGGDYVPVESKVAPLWWQEKGLSFTASGYGGRIPLPYMVHWKFLNNSPFPLFALAPLRLATSSLQGSMNICLRAGSH